MLHDLIHWVRSLPQKCWIDFAYRGQSGKLSSAIHETTIFRVGMCDKKAHCSCIWTTLSKRFSQQNSILGRTNPAKDDSFSLFLAMCLRSFRPAKSRYGKSSTSKSAAYGVWTENSEKTILRPPFLCIYFVREQQCHHMHPYRHCRDHLPL